MSRVMKNLVELKDTLVQKHVIPMFTRAKRELRQNLLRKEEKNAVNELKDADLENDLARQIAITLKQMSDLPRNAIAKKIVSPINRKKEKRTFPQVKEE